jgi:hypothetical protein
MIFTAGDRVKFWNWYVVACVAFALVLLTLIPFDFRLPARVAYPIWYFGFSDALQNMVLFFPLAGC